MKLGIFFSNLSKILDLFRVNVEDVFQKMILSRFELILNENEFLG